MLGSELRERLLREFAGRAHPYPTDRTILGLFEDWAARTPESAALTYGEHTLDYRTLDRKANALADALRGRGVGKGDFVPLVMRNGLDLPVSIVALMKLGAPFVPIDDLWPADRLAAMVSSVRPKVVLHDASVDAAALPADLRVPVDALALPERADGDFGPPAGMPDLIYGFYTSGSTGLPKCTLNIHHGLLNRFLYMTRRFGDSADQVVLQNSRHVFDSSIWQLLWPLTNGAQVVIPHRGGVLDLSVTIDTIHRHGVTMTDFVPSIFNTLVDLLAARPSLVERLASMRTILIGGEEINAGAVRRFRGMLPQVTIVNTYGPTEASIGSVFHSVTDADAEHIPIGKPIDNTYVVVVDEDIELVAPGTVGEILIGGDCLGLGYLGDPAKTEAAFTRNPFPEIPGDRLYRTGDLGTWREDGHLVFAGRRDQQIKIGGVRVELSEIELAMQTHPAIREAKVIVRGDAEAKTLIAFLTCHSPITDAEARAHALAGLPPYLVPKRFVVLDRMPLTPNGKADRRALAGLAEAEQAAAPLHELDDDVRAVRDIWQRLLPGTAIGPDDNFFAKGGDSLSAQRLALALSDRFGVRVSVRDVVEHQTVTAQAALTRGTSQGGADFPADAMARDSVLPADIIPQAPRVPGPPKDILLTGATGFIGVHLLHDLLRGTDATVHCLVRAADADTARERVIEALREYALWDAESAERIVAVPGDLGAERLGAADYEALADTVDVVVHNAAMVNLVLDYAAHRQVNVSGAVEILRFAVTGRTKHVHVVSTLGAVPATDAEIAEAPAPASARPSDGYSQSKLVAERLADAAAERGLPVSVHRLGEVMPHSRHGIPSHNGLPDLIIAACQRVGAVFSGPITFDYTPVDQVSALLTAAVSAGARGHHHLLQPKPVHLDDVLAAFQERFGLPVLSYAEFHQRLAESDDPLVAKVHAVLPEPGEDLTDLFADVAGRYATARTDRLAEDADIVLEPVGTEVFDRYAQARS